MKAKHPLLCILALYACGQHSQSSDLKGFVNTSLLWDNPTAIRVCFENPGEASDEIRSDIVNYATGEYHGKTRIRFQGFGTCTDADQNQPVVRVNFYRRWNWTDPSGDRYGWAGGGYSWIGPQPQSLGGNGGNGTMEIDIGSTGNYPSDNGIRGWAVNYTRGEFMHELGHAIGLMHEHSRTDSPGCPADDGIRFQDTGPLIYVGQYDPYSIMNYCFDYNNAAKLSAGDVDAIALLYPAVGTASEQKTCSNTLRPGEALLRGQKLCSNNHRWDLTIQDDGNVVKHQGSPTNTVWALGTYNSPAVRLVMQTDGNLVLDNGEGGVLWASGTNHGSNYLLLDDDGTITVRSTQNQSIQWSP